MDDPKKHSRALDKPEPMESELGFKFQFVDAPSPPKKIKTDHLQILPNKSSTVSTAIVNSTVGNKSGISISKSYQPEQSLNELQHKDEFPTVLLGESDDDDDECGIRKNVIIKVTKKTYEEAQTQNKANIPKINKKQNKAVNNFKQSQSKPPNLLINKKQFIYYQTPPEISHNSNSKYLDEAPKLFPLNIEPDKMTSRASEKNNSQTSDNIPKLVSLKNSLNLSPSQTKTGKTTNNQQKQVISNISIPTNILKRQLMGVQHQVISSGPVILNSPGLVSINAPVRHFIVPSDTLSEVPLSFDQGYKVYNSLDAIGVRQVSQHDKKISLSQGYKILKPVQRPKEGVVIQNISNLEPGKSVLVGSKRVFKSPMQPSSEPKKTLFFDDLSSSAEPKISTDSQQLPTIKVKPLHTLINPASVVKTELIENEEEYTPPDYPEYVKVSQKSDLTVPEKNIVPINIPGDANENQSSKRPTYKVKLVKIRDKTTVTTTYPTVAEPAMAKHKSKKAKHNYQCFGTFDWMVSYIPYGYKEFGFSACQPKCLAYLKKNIKELEKRIVRAQTRETQLDAAVSTCLTKENVKIVRAQTRETQLDAAVSTCLTKENVKKTYFNKKKLNTIKTDNSQEDNTNNTFYTDVTLEDDIPVSYVQDSDSDCELLVTKKVVILKDGSEEESSSLPEQDAFAGWENKKSKQKTNQPIFTPCYVELKKSALLEQLAIEYYKKLEEEKIRKKWFTANWFNDKIVFNKTYYKKWQTNQKPLLIIDEHSLGAANSNYTKFNTVFPTDRVLPSNPILKNKRFINLVRTNSIRLVHPVILAEYFKNMCHPLLEEESVPK